MSILILNGSPKGNYSITLQTVYYLALLHPEHKYVPPQNFYGIGGMKFFRDLIRLMQGFLISNPKLMGKMGNAMNGGMLMPYKKLLEKNKKQRGAL